MAKTGPGDDELLRAWQAGDDPAGAVLVRRHFDLVFRFFRRRVPADATDLTQRTFAACIESRDRFPETVGFRPFVLGIAHNQLLMHLRANRRRAAALGRARRELLAEPATSLSRAAASRRQRRLLLAALHKLPLDLQLTLELHYWEGLSVDEIGAVLRVRPGSVKARLSRGRSRLADILAKLAVSPTEAEETLSKFSVWANELRDKAYAKSDENS